MSFIEDGTGSGKLAKVNNENRLIIGGAVLDVTELVTSKGCGFNLNTGTINLTSANESGLIYLKNNGDKDIWIDAFVYLVGNSTGGSGDYFLTVYANPTGGTLLSGSDVTPVNRNLGSTETVTADVKVGAEGSTVTGGTVLLESLIDKPGKTLTKPGLVVVPKGKSVAVSMQPQSGNTSQNVQIAMQIYIDIEEL